MFQSNPDVFIHFIVLHAIEENAIGNIAHTKRTGDAEWDKEGDTNISIEYVLNKWILIERIRDVIQPFIIDLCLLVLL